MERRENLPDSVWKSHLDWFNVTGETSHRHIREHHQGKLGVRYQAHETEVEAENSRRSSHTRSSQKGPEN